MKLSNSIFLRGLGLLTVPALLLASCSDDNSEPNNGGDENDAPAVEAAGKFVIATSQTASGNTTYALLTAESLDEGRIAPPGLLNEGATQWVYFGNDYLYALTYNQGNDGGTRSYLLNSAGNVEERDMRYSVSRFSSYGVLDNGIITMSTGDGPTTLADSHGYLPQTLLFTFIDVNNETSRPNDTSTGVYSMENLLGNGEYVTLSGAEPSNGRIFCGAIPMGLSQYGYSDGNGKWLRGPEYQRLVHTSDGGSGGGSYKANTLVGTQYPDDCWVAIYSDETMTNPVIAHTDKISTPCGRFRSQYYQTVWAAENGDIYVFSSSYAKTMTDPLQQTKLPAGVARIPAGKTEFDNYYVNIEAQANGRSFMRCWPATGNYFLMVMYDRPLTESGFAATDLAIFDANSGTLTYVDGLPADVTSIGKTVYTQNGCVYIPINCDSDYPAIYRIDPTTAKATKGLTIEATEVTGFGFMKSKN